MLAQATNNDPVRLGAIRARLDAMAQRATLLRLGGYLSATRRAEMVEADIRRMGEDIFKAIEKHQVPDEVVEDLLEALDSPVGPSNGTADRRRNRRFREAAKPTPRCIRGSL